MILYNTLDAEIIILDSIGERYHMVWRKKTSQAIWKITTFPITMIDQFIYDSTTTDIEVDYITDHRKEEIINNIFGAHSESI